MPTATAESRPQSPKYVDVESTSVRGTKAVFKDDVLVEAKRTTGCFALLSNGIKDPVEALSIYRHKDMVEKAFDKQVKLYDKLGIPPRYTWAGIPVRGRPRQGPPHVRHRHVHGGPE